MSGKPKLTTVTLDEFRDLLGSDELMSIIMTDEELFLELNKKLLPENRVSYRTFQRYKRQAMRFEEEMPTDIDPIYEELYTIIRLAQIRQKRTLVHNLMNCNMQDFHKYKWILERKFADFNLAQINRKAEAEARQIEAEQAAELKAIEDAKPKKAPTSMADWLMQMPRPPRGEAKYIGDDVYYGEEGYDDTPSAFKNEGQGSPIPGFR